MGSDTYVFGLDGDDGFMGVYLSPNSLSCIGQMWIILYVSTICPPNGFKNKYVIFLKRRGWKTMTN